MIIVYQVVHQNITHEFSVHDDAEVFCFRNHLPFSEIQILERPEIPPVPTPKILKYYIGGTRRHFHTIDHNIDLSITTKIKEVYGVTNEDRGLLLQKEYYSDNELTDLLFRIQYSYQKNAYGHLTHQRVQMIWINEDGSENTDIKDKGFAAYSPQESRTATRNRRQAVIFQLEQSLIGLLTQASNGDPSSLAVGAYFMEAASSAINQFYNSGLIDSIVAFVNDPATINQFNFLMLELAPGYTVAQYIISGVTYD